MRGAHLGARRHHIAAASDFEEADINAKGGGGYPNGSSNDDTSRFACRSARGMSDEVSKILTDITPNGDWVVDIMSPNNRVDELVEATQGRPNHVVAGSSVQCLGMPR